MKERLHQMISESFTSLPNPEVWSPRGPVPADPVFPFFKDHSNLSSVRWVHLQRPLSKVQLLSAGVIVVGMMVGGMESAGMYVHGLKLLLKLMSSSAMSPW